jgi:uncharacterized protein (TIGR02678 family)
MDPNAPDRDVQRAFTGLLARPLVTAASDPALYRAVTRHADAVSQAARRLGYRLAATGQAFRLVRVPVAGTVTAPPPPLNRPGRRVLALACVLAAACDQVTSPVTLARLAAAVQELTSGPTATVAPFDPALLAHGRQLAEAASLLEYWGVLRPRRPGDRPADDQAVGAQAAGNQAAGDQAAAAGYDIDPAALDLLTSPDVLSAALAPAVGPGPSAEDLPGASRPVRVLRALVETPAVLYADLAEDDAAALRATRGLRSSEAAHLTGGHVEARAEGLTVIIDDEPPSPVTSDWPGASNAARVALLLAEAAGRAGERQPDGTVVLTSDQADEQASAVHAAHRPDLAGPLRDDPAAVRAAAEQQLAALGLLRVRPDGGWALSPVAGRYRAAGDRS